MPSTRTLLPIVLLSLVFPIVSCSDRPSNTPPSGPVTITYWEKWNGFEGEAIRDVVGSFNKSQTLIHVDLVTVSEIEYKLLVATAGGDPPDISGLYSRNVQVYADKGALLPLDEGMALHGVRLSDFIPAYLKECRLREGTYALPIAGMTLALHYNKAHFRAAGLDPERPPRTIEEFEAACERLTLLNKDGSIRQLGFTPAEPGWWNWSWPYYFGGSLYDQGTHSLSGETPENVRALGWIRGHSKKYDIRKLTAFQGGFGNFASPQNAFLAGKLSMVLQGVWMHAFIQNFNPKLDWGVAPFPAFSKEVHDVTLIESDVAVIPRGSRHPKEAVEFLAYLVGVKGQEELNLKQMKFPMRKEVSADFWRKHPNPRLKVYRKLADSPNAFTAPRMPLFAELFDEGNDLFDQVWLQRRTPEEGLREFQGRLGKLWKRELRRLDRLGLRPPD